MCQFLRSPAWVIICIIMKGIPPSPPNISDIAGIIEPIKSFFSSEVALAKNSSVIFRVTLSFSSVLMPLTVRFRYHYFSPKLPVFCLLRRAAQYAFFCVVLNAPFSLAQVKRKLVVL